MKAHMTLSDALAMRTRLAEAVNEAEFVARSAAEAGDDETLRGALAERATQVRNMVALDMARWAINAGLPGGQLPPGSILSTLRRRDEARHYLRFLEALKPVGTASQVVRDEIGQLRGRGSRHGVIRELTKLVDDFNRKPIEVELSGD